MLKLLDFCPPANGCQRIILASANSFVAFSGGPANVPPTAVVAQSMGLWLNSPLGLWLFLTSFNGLFLIVASLMELKYDS